MELSTGTNTINAKGFDWGGNWSAIATISAKYALPDTSPPTVSITTPVNGQAISASPITVSGSASDPGAGNSGVALVEVRVNGGPWQSASSTNDWSSWACQVALTPGSNTIEARSADNAGNYSSTNASVIVRCAPIGDINGDGYVNVGDLQAVIAAWGSDSVGGWPNWNQYADLNDDGCINVADLQVLAAHWSRSLN